MVMAWHGRGMPCVNQTRSLCVNQMGKRPFKPWAAKPSRGTAWYVWICHNGALVSSSPAFPQPPWAHFGTLLSNSHLCASLNERDQVFTYMWN
jgi:hypothetical protein